MKQPLARAFGGEAFWLRRVETALIPMLPLPIPFFFFFFSLSLRCWVYSYGPLYSTPEYFLHPSLCPLSHLLRCWSRPVQAQLSPSPTLPKTRYPHGGTAGCFPHLFLALLSTVSPGKKQQQCFSLFLYLCQSFSSSLLPACHDQRHVFTDSVGCGAQRLRLPLWWWP